jgi:putative salt-induced outer membrane protein YdiY
MKFSYTVSLTAAVLALLGTTVTSRAADIPVTTTNKWESSAAAGATLTRGNSRTFLGTLSIGTGKKWNQNELAFGVDAAYGTTEETRTTVVDPGPPPVTTKKDVTTTTAQSAHAFGQYNRLFTERFYGYGRLEGLHDEVADITYRLSVSPGAGYYFFKSKPTELSVEAGPGYIYQKLGHDTDSYATLRFAEKFKQELSDRARLWQTAEILPQVDDFKNYIINFEIGLEADLSASKKFSLRVYLDDTYNNVPAVGRKNNDLKLVAALACKF